MKDNPTIIQSVAKYENCIECSRQDDEIKYIVFEHNDPRILGDNYSEVSKTISFIGRKEEALEHYKQMKNAMKFSGTNCTYFSYPIKLKDSDCLLQLGEKITIHPEKKFPDDDDFENTESDFFDVDHNPNW